MGGGDGSVPAATVAGQLYQDPCRIHLSLTESRPILLMPGALPRGWAFGPTDSLALWRQS